MKDVSRCTGLSISTISKYINGGNVLAKNQALIGDAIQTLNFKVNRQARSLKTNRTMTVGILLPALDISFFAGIVADVEARLFKEGYNAIICSFDHDPAQEARKLAFLIDQQVDGLILVAEHMTALKLREALAQRERVTPTVLLDRFVEGIQSDYVLVDNVRVCELATEQFILHGHKRIGLIMGPPAISTARERLAGYSAALCASGIDPCPDLVKVGDYSVNAGYRLFGELIDMPNPPTAILSTNYEMTLGAVTAAYERNLKIPSEISFIGYDDPQLTQIIKPPITIVLQPTAQIAATTAELLLKRMHGDYSGFPHAAPLKASLMLNESIARIK
ncbi:MAG: LacI family DNA-binding transcriptional regulator [Clostridia bacterium]